MRFDAKRIDGYIVWNVGTLNRARDVDLDRIRLAVCHTGSPGCPVPIMLDHVSTLEAFAIDKKPISNRQATRDAGETQEVIRDLQEGLEDPDEWIVLTLKEKTARVCQNAPKDRMDPGQWKAGFEYVPEAFNIGEIMGAFDLAGRWNYRCRTFPELGSQIPRKAEANFGFLEFAKDWIMSHYREAWEAGYRPPMTSRKTYEEHLRHLFFCEALAEAMVRRPPDGLYDKPRSVVWDWIRKAQAENRKGRV